MGCFRSIHFNHLSSTVLTVSASLSASDPKSEKSKVCIFSSLQLPLVISLASVISVCVVSHLCLVSLHCDTSLFSLPHIPLHLSLSCLPLWPLSHHFSSLSFSSSSLFPIFPLFHCRRPPLPSVFNLTLLCTLLIFKLEVESATSLRSRRDKALSFLSVYILSTSILYSNFNLLCYWKGPLPLIVLDLYFCLSPGQPEQKSFQPAKPQHQRKDVNVCV